MSQRSEQEMLHQVKKAASQLTPDFSEELWTRPVEAADKSAWFLDSSARSQRNTPRRRYAAMAVAACLVLCLVSAWVFQSMPSASVYLDVNPSVSLQVNYRNRVTKVEACNEDAVEVLGDLDFKGTDLDVALYAILGSMVQHGYLTQAQDTILVSVYSANAGRARELKQTVSDMVSQSLETMITAGEVLSQQVEKEHSSKSEAQNSTPGKAAFVEDLEKKYPQLEEDALENRTVDEIVQILTEEELDYSDYLEEPNDEDDEDDDIFEEDENDEDDEDDEDMEEDDEDEDDEDDEN